MVNRYIGNYFANTLRDVEYHFFSSVFINCKHPCKFPLETFLRSTFFSLKTVYAIGNFQRPDLLPTVYEHIHKVTNLWKFELDWSSETRSKKKKKMMLDFGASNSKLEVSKSNSWKIRGSRLSQCFIPLASPRYSFTKWGLLLIVILSNNQ